MKNSILAEILKHKRLEISRLKKNLSLSEAKSRAENVAPARNFLQALLSEKSEKKPKIIAEIKKASPSKGAIARNFDPVSIGLQYQKNGAAAVSVLTDKNFFRGDLNFLTAVRNEISLPVLRKDFLTDPLQIYQSRAAGADSALLITAAVSGENHLADLISLSRSLAMEPLVEVHNEQELETALRAQSRIIGINNRNLSTFEVDLSVSKALAPMIEKDKVTVSESGISSLNDILSLMEYGVDAFLIGEKFMRSDSPGDVLREMINGRAL